jgi:hypothetical protein
MMLRTKHGWWVALLTVALWPAGVRAQVHFADFAAAQEAGKPAISAAGTTTVHRDPTRMRLYIQLLAKGKTLEDALAKLKERRQAAVAQLETLKADKNSIVFGTPSLSKAASDRKQQIAAMVMEQMRNRGKKLPKGLQTPPTVTVTTTLTAEWPLKTASQDELLLMAQGIEEQIKAADMAGTKEAETLAPEEQELEEEATQVTPQFGEETSPPGQPHFVFVAVLTKEDRETAMTEAFANAKQRAAELAKAAGVNLGPLIGLSGRCSGQNNFDGGFSAYDPYGRSDFFRQIMAQQNGESPDGKQDETMNQDPGALKFVCYATVQFELGK